MNKWPKYNWCVLLSLFLCIFLLTSCSTTKIRSFIRALADDETQNTIEKSSIPTTDNEKGLLDDELKKKDKEITTLRANLNNLNGLKTKIENKNKEISRLKKELNRVTYLNNSQPNQISRLKNELDQTINIKQAQKKEIIHLKNEIDQTINSKQVQQKEIARLKNELNQIINSKQAWTFEEIEESNFFEPAEEASK